MRRLIYILFQLDEARRYIQDGRLERLRLALLLSDNAAELQMDGQIKHDLMHEQIQEKLREKVLDIPAGDRSKTLQEVVDWVPLPRSRKKKIERFFDEKVEYLSERKGYLRAEIVEPLKYLHRYRNEAYHRAKIRKETILTAAVLLLEINCQMLLALPNTLSFWESDGDYSWINERFGEDAMSVFMTSEAREKIVTDIRSGLTLQDKSVANALFQHVKSRLQELYDALDFIVENSSAAADRELGLRLCQLFMESETGAVKASEQSLKAYSPKYTLGSIDSIESKANDILQCADRLKAFYRFSLVEANLEPIEHAVEALSTEIDHAIQMAVDISRGK